MTTPFEQRLALRLAADPAGYAHEKLPELIEAFGIFEPRFIYDVKKYNREGLLPLDDKTLKKLLKRPGENGFELLESDDQETAQRFSIKWVRNTGTWFMRGQLDHATWDRRADEIRATVAWLFQHGAGMADLHHVLDQTDQEERLFNPETGQRSSEHLPGHSHMIPHLMLAPSAITWYGEGAYRSWLPEARVASFADGLRNEEVTEGMREIALLECPYDIEAARTDAHRQRQWKLRQHLALCEVGIPNDPRNRRLSIADPFAELIEADLPAGVKRRIRYFVGDAGQRCPVSMAAGHEDFDIPG